MTTTPPSISKSRVQSGAQCTLKLWYDCFERELAPPADELQQFIFDRGTQIGELARDRYPGGNLIDAEYYETPLALKQTSEALVDASIPALFEPAFIHQNVTARIDVLERAGTDAWDLIEVKGASRTKDVYLRDLAIQLWIARGAGLSVRRAGLLLLNREYVYDGNHLDLDRLFSFVDSAPEALAMHDEVESLVHSLQDVLAQDAAPRVEPGEQCSTPYPCPYYEHCTKGYAFPEHPLDNLPRLHANKRAELEELGIVEVHEIPDDFPLNTAQARARECVLTGEDWVSQELGDKLADISYPVHHLDFEAFMPAIPIYAGTRPFDAVPFQYSIHVEAQDGTLKPLEYLCTSDEDPRRELAERLLVDLGERGSICVYSGYERTVIKALARDLPDLRDALEALLQRIWDLLPIIRKHYYHPAFRGSFSIKSVLPALVPGLTYDGMAVADGRTAASKFEIALGLDDEDARTKIYEDLRIYCAQDTLAMVELRRALARRVR